VKRPALDETMSIANSLANLQRQDQSDHAMAFAHAQRLYPDGWFVSEMADSRVRPDHPEEFGALDQSARCHECVAPKNSHAAISAPGSAGPTRTARSRPKLILIGGQPMTRRAEMVAQRISASGEILARRRVPRTELRGLTVGSISRTRAVKDRRRQRNMPSPATRRDHSCPVRADVMTRNRTHRSRPTNNFLRPGPMFPR